MMSEQTTGTIAALDEEALEGVEHGVARGWGTAHVLDRNERHPTMT